jgi:C1A family cysteine protease
LIFFRTKTRSETNNTSKPNTTNRNNEQEQTTTHQQQEQRTISNTKKETQAPGSKQIIKDMATNQTTFNVVLVFYIACSILRSDFLVRALMVFRVWRS